MADEDTKPNMESVKLNIKVKAQVRLEKYVWSGGGGYMQTSASRPYDYR